MADGLNIPSGEGLLEAQQKTAAEIPYKNIEVNQNAIKGVMNTFMMAQQVGNKRRQLEQQLQMAYMKNDLDERKFGMQMDNMATRHALQVATLEQRAAHQGDMLEMAGRGMQLREAGAELDRAKFDFAVDKQEKRTAGTQAIIEIENQMAAEGLDPEKPGYFTEYTSRLNSRAANAPASIFNKALGMARTKVNNSADRLAKENAAKMTSFSEDIGRTLFGDPKFQDLRVLDPANLTDETTQEQSPIDRWLWNKPVPPPKPTGNKVYTYPTTAGDKSITISSKKLTELNKTYNSIIEEGKRIPSRVPQSAVPESTEDPSPLPADKAQLKPDKTYFNSKGQVYRWTGTGFVPP